MVAAYLFKMDGCCIAQGDSNKIASTKSTNLFFFLPFFLRPFLPLACLLAFLPSFLSFSLSLLLFVDIFSTTRTMPVSYLEVRIYLKSGRINLLYEEMQILYHQIFRFFKICKLSFCIFSCDILIFWFWKPIKNVKWFCWSHFAKQSKYTVEGCYSTTYVLGFFVFVFSKDVCVNVCILGNLAFSITILEFLILKGQQSIKQSFQSLIFSSLP